MHAGRRRAALAGASVLAVALGAHDAAACGVFFSGPPARPLSDAELDAKLPYLAHERVLVVWNRKAQTEDFVREARFERADQAFGFVVPVPSTAEVFRVAHQPFTDLDRHYPFSEPVPEPGSGQGLGAVGGAAAAPRAVIVESKQRIGSFTAFVLSADDGGGLASWLKGNGLRMTPAAQPWLDHYVRLHFHFVAFRYDVPATPGAGGMTSETVRIRFKTPLPYYPYLEPTHPGPAATDRALSVWLVTDEPMVPVAALQDASPVGFSWNRPWHEGQPTDVTAASLRADVPAIAELVPEAGSLTLQEFHDGRMSRAGWGDVLMVPERGAPLDDAAIAARWPLVAVVDQRLEGDADAAPLPASEVFPDAGAAPEPDASATPTPERHASRSGCDVVHGPAPAGGAVAVAAALASVAARRRRGRPMR